MRNMNKIAVLLLAGVCIFAGATGCKQKNAENVTEKAEKAEKAEDDTIIMSVGDELVSVDEVNAYAFFLKQQYEGNVGRVIWDYNMENETLADYAKEQIKSLISQLKILKQEAKKQGIELMEEEKEEARSYAIAFLDQLEEDKKQESYLSEDLLTSIYEENILANKIFEISTNDVDTNISDDEAKQISIQCLTILTKGTDKNGNSVVMTEEAKKKAKVKAKSLFKDAKEAENFLSFAQSNSDVEEVEYTFSKAEAAAEFPDAVFTMKSGEYDFLEGENGYYIVYCVNDDDEDATARRKEEIILERQKVSFEEKFSEWSSNYPIVVSTTLWDEIKF